ERPPLSLYQSENARPQESGAKGETKMPYQSYRELAQALQPKVRYPDGTPFGERVWVHYEEKRRIAAHIAWHLIQDGQEVFIADGSSGLWVMIALLELGRDVKVRTNNLAAAFEAMFWPNSPSRVVIAPGVCNRHYAGIFGDEAVDFCKD